jgi:prepilin-type N-terminal cleavage/methylation domain-containing protein
MSARRSSATSSKTHVRGFTLPEVLICAAIAGIVTLAASSGYVFMTKSWVQQQARLQTQQQLRSAVAAVTREMRVAGACMLDNPPADVQPLSGVDNGTTDSITIRANPHCAKGAIAGADCASCTSFTVNPATNFAGLGGTWGYLYAGPGQHQYFKILSVVGSTINVDTTTGPPITGTYLQNTTGVYAVEARAFAISSTCPTCGGVPSLTLTTLGGTETALVKGVDLFDIRYVLNDDYDPTNCVSSTGGGRPLCVADLPQSAAGWKKVRSVIFDVGARSLRGVGGAGSSDGFLHHDEIFQISPRNFQFPDGRL